MQNMIGTHCWNGFVIKQNWKRLVAICNNEIDDGKTSKQNNHVGDNNKGGNQNMSEEEDGGKRVNKSSSSDDDEDKNQYKDDNNKANKEKITTSFWRTIQMKKINGMNK